MAKRVYIADLDAHTVRIEKKLAGIEQKTIGASQKMEKAFMKVGTALAAAFSAQQVLNFMKSSIESFKAQELAIKKLDTALGRSTKSLQRYASELQKITTFGDEVTIEAMARIGVFVKEESQLKGLTKAAMDFAIVMDMDLAGAADLITKTFASSTNALSRYGLTVEGGAGTTERYNSLMQAMVKYQGQAEGQAKTLTGQLEQLNNELDDQQEKIGEQLLPVWVALNKALNFGVTAIMQGGIGYALKQRDERNQIATERLSETMKMVGLAGPIAITQNKTVEAEKEITENKREQLDLTIQQYDVLEDIFDAVREMNEEDTILSDYKDPSGAAGRFGPDSLIGKAGKAGQELVEKLDDAASPMSALVSLSNQMASNFSFAGHTFVGQLSQAIAMVDSISNMILTVASMFGGGGGFGLGGLLSLIGLEKGGRISNLSGNISHTKIPSFAMGGSYSTPSHSGPFAGGYPVMVHKNETLDVYNAGQSSRMEKKLDGIRNAIMAGTLASTRGGSGGGSVTVNIDGQKLFKILTVRSNRASRSNVNTGEMI